MSNRAQVAAGLGGALAGAGLAAVWTSDPLIVLASAVLGAALGIARAHPRVAWIAAAAAILSTASLASLSPGGPPAKRLPDGVYVLAIFQAFAAGRWDHGRSAIAALVVLTAAFVTEETINGGEFVPALFLPVALWAGGRALGDHERTAAQLKVRARELEEEREAHTELSVRYERARIASEMHDIVAHAISVMVVQASAGQRLAARDPELAGESFRAIAGAARQAEADMGRLVELLGEAGGAGGAPDLDLLDELVARAAGSGLDVTLRFEGRRDDLPPSVVAVAYRVVQEGLTNALRYASGAPVAVVVDGRERELVVEVRNGEAPGEAELAGSGTGNGLRGLRERVSARGGTVSAGPGPGGGWLLKARVPCAEPVEAA